MSKKSKQTTTQDSTNKLSAYAPVAPVLDRSAGIMNSYLNDPQSTAVYSGPRVASLSGDTQQGLSMLRNSSGANTSAGYLTNLLGTASGSNNPAIQQMQDAIQRQVMAANNATFSRSGTVGGTAHQESLAKGLADGLAQPLFNAYESDEARKLQAAGLLPTVSQQAINNQLGAGQILDSYSQNKINAEMQKFKEQQLAPLQGVNAVFPYASQLGSQFGTQTGRSTNTQSSSPGVGQQVLGGLMMGAGALSGNPMLGAQLSGMMGGNVALAPWSWGTTTTNANGQVV